jgi:mannose-6-phosphate isomerase-like protein (cupin superfamily)
MYHLIRPKDLPPDRGGTVAFQGEPYDANLSFFLVNNRPGDGPVLHVHPYAETWIVHQGRVLFTVSADEIAAGPGDIVVVGAHTPHKFRNIGEGALVLTCIHPSNRFIQMDLVESDKTP